jgi:hypothetical protein
VEIGAEAALFPEKEYINGIAVAVQHSLLCGFSTSTFRHHVAEMLAYFTKMQRKGDMQLLWFN